MCYEAAMVMPNIIAIVQARMGSSRLPGKSLKYLGKDTVMAHVLRRLSFARHITQIVSAIPLGERDDMLAHAILAHGLPCFRGSPDNVLDRFYRAALAYEANIVVRITGDCPLIDPEIVDEILSFFLSHDYDYVSNTVVRSYPRGFDCEVFSFAALARTWEQATVPYEKEHVTPYIYQHRDVFSCYDVVAPLALTRPDIRLCVDTDDDFRMLSAVCDAFDDNAREMTAAAIVSFLDIHPDIVGVNRHVMQKTIPPASG